MDFATIHSITTIVYRSSVKSLEGPPLLGADVFHGEQRPLYNCHWLCSCYLVAVDLIKPHGLVIWWVVETISESQAN